MLGSLDSALSYLRCSRADTSLFVYAQGCHLVYILVYVNDFIITGSSPLLVQQFIHQLAAIFPIKDHGALHYFLGIEAHCTSSRICLTQHKYIVDHLRKTNMLLAKPVSSPMASSSQLSAHEGSLFANPTLYQSTVGSLRYLSFT